MDLNRRNWLECGERDTYSRTFISFSRSLVCLLVVSFCLLGDARADNHDKVLDAEDLHRFHESIWEIGGSKFRVSFDIRTSRFLGTWEKSEKLFLDVAVSENGLIAVSGVALIGEISVKFPNAQQACPNRWKVWTKFQGALGFGSNIIEGWLRELRIDMETCSVLPTGERISLTFRRVAEPVAALCGPPALRAALKSLEKLLTRHTRVNSNLPSKAMFNRPGLSDLEASDAASWRTIVDEQIRRGGADDWLHAAGDKGGTIRRLIDEVRPFADSDANRDRAQWQALAPRLEQLVKALGKRHRYVRNVYQAVDANYDTWGTKIRSILDSAGSDHTLMGQLGFKGSNAGAASIYMTIFSMIYASPGNPISAIINTWKSFKGAVVLGNVIHGQGLVPFYLEMAEHRAWLQPLVGAYSDLERASQNIVECVRQHNKLPQSD